MLEAAWKPSKLKGWYFSGAIAGDSGKLLGKSFGGMISIGKTGFFKL